MALLELLRLGHPVLRSQADRIADTDIRSEELQQLIDDMVETMTQAEGVGLAAPQVGQVRQVFVFRAPNDEVRVAINPLMTAEGGELVDDWEGCLSIPGLRGLVPRYPAVRLQALDRDGEAFDEVFEGFSARIVQHENDHLNGVLFLDRMRNLRSLCFTEEWEQLLSDMGLPHPAAVG
ncbi:MAG: peptide deformylase [Acidobacteriota bacterium]